MRLFSRRSPWMMTFVFLLLPVSTTYAQDRASALSDGDVEKLRDMAYDPNERVLMFVGFLDDRAKAVERLTTGPRKRGREDDLHEQFEQFISIADEFNDNLDDYGSHHRDVRKVLPKLVQATDRWATMLRTPPNDDAYNVSRRLALEAVRDLQEEAVEMIAEQKEWFAKHPPDKGETSGKPHS